MKILNKEKLNRQAMMEAYIVLMHMDEEEIYGAIINYSIQENGNYSAALQSEKMIKENIKSEVTEETLGKAKKIRIQKEKAKKAKKLARNSVKPESLKQIEQIGMLIDEAIKENKKGKQEKSNTR